MKVKVFRKEKFLNWVKNQYGEDSKTYKDYVTSKNGWYFECDGKVVKNDMIGVYIIKSDKWVDIFEIDDTKKVDIETGKRNINDELKSMTVEKALEEFDKAYVETIRSINENIDDEEFVNMQVLIGMAVMKKFEINLKK